jgi:hypothetical protein
MSSNASPRASSVWVEMPFMRGPVGAQRLRELLPVLRDVREKTQLRRARVLSHEWACRRVCLILNLPDARQWNGYIPPARDDHGRRPSNPIREALIELCKEVEAAEGLGFGE